MASPPKIGEGGKKDAKKEPRSGDYLERLLASLPEAMPDAPHRDQITYLPHYQLTPNREQPRRHFDPEALEDLAESIRAADGIIQPLLVKKIASQRYEIIAGERRWRAASIIDLDEVPCIIRDDVSGARQVMFSLIENIQRNQLNPIEEATGLRRLIDEFGMSHQEAANAVGRSRSAVTNLLRLLELAESVQEALADGRIEMGHARALAGADYDGQAHLLTNLLDEGWSVRQTEAAVRGWKAEDGGATDKKTPKAYYPKERLQQMETRLVAALGYEVKIKASAQGKVSITLDTLDDLALLLAASEKDQEDAQD